MAGDWIKMRSDLFEHPKVFKLADMLGVDEFSVVGMLFCFWAWADKHSVDGRVDAATSRLVDKCAQRSGFADALVSVGWLVVDDSGITIPRFNEHNGDSSKERTLKNQRQARWRANKRDACVDGEASTSPSTQPPTSATTREEKRREEYSVSKDTAAKDRVWTLGPALLGEKSRGLLGKLVAQYGEDVLAEALGAAVAEKPGEPKAWVVKACEAAAKRQEAAAKLGGHPELLADTKPEWALRAGFANRFEANNDGCFEHNAEQFRDGKRVAA